jgi:hypothetical protein
VDQQIKKLIWLVVFSMVLSACEGVFGTLTPTPTPGVTPCPPNSNPYVTSIGSNLNAIYETCVKTAGDSVAYNNIQQQALTEFVNHVAYLTDTVEIQSGENTLRITITYISPELVHIIILNHYLYKRYLDYSGKLNEQVQSHIARIIGRNEYVFFISFSASNYTNNQIGTFIFPLKELKLTSTNNETVLPMHDDHFLKKPIDLKDGPKYGFFYYPMAVQQNGPCETILDNNYDTSIELSIPGIVISEKEMGSQSWHYKIAPLIDMTNISGTHQNRFSLPLLPDQFSPKTSMLTATNAESYEFWLALSRIIWLEITQDS